MTASSPAADPLAPFSSPVRSWFTGAFPAPTPAQAKGWEAIASGAHTLLLAPTGSGKTLAAFLWCLDRLVQRPPLPNGRDGKPRRAGVSVVYVSPLKALSYDIERNLRAPLAGLRIAALREGLPEPDITVGVRTGDTPARDREDFRRHPPDILITTPESLYLLLTSKAREALATVETVIVDEIHTMASTKRGAHLALSLERLERLTGREFQRIGLSATQRPLDEVARYLGGDRPVRVVDAGSTRPLDLEVIVPLEDMTRPADYAGPIPESELSPEQRTSVWPAFYQEILQLVRSHRSTLVFVNNRRLAERIAARVNELAGETLLRAHHGSVSREQRFAIEEQLKAGQLPGIVCTSSMELGIDMGAVDLVVQVESPKSVASGLQRVGRAGHQVDGVSRGRLLPKHRADLLECAVVARRMREGAIEATHVPRNPLDVLAQQIVAACAVEDLTVDDVLAMARRSYPFATLGREQLEGVLGMLAGRYPSDEFAELRPRVTWDPDTGVVSTRRDAKTLAIINAGTIPDRGLYGVYLGEDGPRVGELDEEMVYESRPGETFLLGATTWRVERITRDRVIVSPAPGQPGKMPFWRGDGVGRSAELGEAVGALVRALERRRADEAAAWLERETDLEGRAARNLAAYLAEEREATGYLPTDRRIVVERYLDELGDWRIVVLSPYGGRVHAPWAMAVEARLAAAGFGETQVIWGDDGIAIRAGGAEEPPPTDLLFPPADEVEDLVIERLGGTALFAGRFRENAGRALLLPRRRPGARAPLWLQRQRAADLLAVASKYGSFPIVLETYRECLQDVFDLPALTRLLRAVEARDIEVREAAVRDASPFARSLALEYVAAFMYEGDLPLAERKAQALTLDRALLRDLLGEADLRELLDPEAVAAVELELQGLAGVRKPADADALHDLLRRLGDLTLEEVAARVADPAEAGALLQQLAASGRACAVRIAGEERWIPAEDAARYRDAVGAVIPQGVPGAFAPAAPGALGSLLLRYARARAPFATADPAGRWRLPPAIVADALAALEAEGRLVRGEFRPGGSGDEWCHPEVLRLIKRRSIARHRREVEPVDGAAFARFLPAWHGVPGKLAGLDGLRDAIARLEGYPMPASMLERAILPARVEGYTPAMLDALCAAGEVVWFGAGRIRDDDGRVVLAARERLPAFVSSEPPPGEGTARAVYELLQARGAQFFADIVAAIGAPVREVLDALWDLAWAGLVTNDTYAPVRAWLARGGDRRPVPGGRLHRLPPESGGRWAALPPAADRTRSLHAWAGALLERRGVVTREAANAEALRGGFSALYPVFREMEERGRTRRGYFVEGLGGAQFALAGAVERLRAERAPAERPRALLLAAVDPAQPYGEVLPWPGTGDGANRRSPARAAGSFVILVEGAPVLLLERWGKSVVRLGTLSDEADGALAAALDALAAAAPALAPRGLTIERIDGGPAAESPLAAALTARGFAAGYRGLVYRPGARRDA
ncbi:DEAD/DEAH box helicase [Tepidiforma sp.]|uniref:Lhr family helicase n=1 Tax=Tepidiforma sp. TaxID=2682230 RepID=UPI00260C4590|nr:DEAD/DEAH box helicase [Tepidiforma sp.]MCX7616817.1 DEAD/DEAH box helicase [Tepidiforma sp.]